MEMPFTAGGGDYQNLEALIFSSRCSFQFVSDVTLFFSQRNCLKSYFPELFAINAGSCCDGYCGPLPEQERLLTFAFPSSWEFPQDSSIVNLKNILGNLEQKTQSLKEIRSIGVSLTFPLELCHDLVHSLTAVCLVAV